MLFTQNFFYEKQTHVTWTPLKGNRFRNKLLKSLQGITVYTTFN